jgi:hypothetical protein
MGIEKGRATRGAHAGVAGAPVLRERFLTSTFDIHVIDIRYSQFSTDCFANDDNLQYLTSA